MVDDVPETTEKFLVGTYNLHKTPDKTPEENFEKDIRKVDQFIKNLRKAGIPLKQVQEILDDKKSGSSKVYKHSKINHFEAYLCCVRLEGFIGRTFQLLSGNGILEYDRSNKDFDFKFSYTAYERIDQEILERLRGLRIGEVKHTRPRTISYEVIVYPADERKIERAYKEIELVNRKLRLAPKISRTLDQLLSQVK